MVTVAKFERITPASHYYVPGLDQIVNVGHKRKAGTTDMFAEHVYPKPDPIAYHKGYKMERSGWIRWLWRRIIE